MFHHDASPCYHACCSTRHLLQMTFAAVMPNRSDACGAASEHQHMGPSIAANRCPFFYVVPSNILCLRMQIGVRQVIAGWDEGILGDGQDLPPMKVTPFWQHHICNGSVACCAGQDRLMAGHVQRHLFSTASTMDLDLTTSADCDINPAASCLSSCGSQAVVFRGSELKGQ